MRCKLKCAMARADISKMCSQKPTPPADPIFGYFHRKQMLQALQRQDEPSCVEKSTRALQPAKQHRAPQADDVSSDVCWGGGSLCEESGERAVVGKSREEGEDLGVGRLKR